VYQPRGLKTKLKPFEIIKNEIKALQQQGKKIVFTNGCFDILHAGHVDIFQQARNLGDALVVAVNSDISIKKIKGEKRPVVPQAQRMQVLAALEAIDYVVIFEEEDPFQVIKELQPDILVKGGDWPVETIVGREIVEKKGGKVLSIPLMEGISTTNIIEAVKKRFCS
jgi:rfaE bifunctional protein nucleotidyltransferase chain/domain